MVDTPKRFAEMTPPELRQWVIDHDANDYDESFAALRDAIRAETLREEYELRLSLIHRAERAEQERGSARRICDAVAKALGFSAGYDPSFLAGTILSRATADGYWQNRASTAESALGEARREAWKSANVDYDRALHHNPDARAWAEFFVANFPNSGADLGLMTGWFANAMMAMYDSKVAEARREGARELADALEADFVGYEWVRMRVRQMRDREYPATPSGEGVTKCAGDCGEWCVGRDNAGCRATPSGEGVTNPLVDGMVAVAIDALRATPHPEPLVIPVCVQAKGRTAHEIDAAFIAFTAADARRLLALAQTTTEGR